VATSCNRQLNQADWIVSSLEQPLAQLFNKDLKNKSAIRNLNQKNQLGTKDGKQKLLYTQLLHQVY